MGADRRATGSYYTPADAAHTMAHWVLRAPGERVLEPSFGDGAFLAALRDVTAARRLSGVEIHGVELAATAHGAAGELAGRAYLADFLALQPFPVDAVIGNPPYVRLRHLAAPQRASALAAATTVLRAPMDPSGSVWMPFALHATRFLRPGGRLALVLPYELTHVRYARPLWEHLAKNFGSLRVCRIYQRLFPELLQDVVILYADGFGAGTTEVALELYERVADFGAGRPAHSASVAVDDVLAGRKPFMTAMLPGATRSVLAGLDAHTVPVADVCSVAIGYVCGDKRFFHPPVDVAARYGLQRLAPSLTSARSLRGAGLRTSGVPAPDRLLRLSPSDTLTPGEAEYVREGEAGGVDRRYKCRIRNPWWAVPGVGTPDVIFSVFSAFPTLLVNDAGHVASNSLLCGYLRGWSAERFALGWYTPLTVLETELKVHALGGGVLILIPGEVNPIRLLRPGPDGDRAALDNIDRCLRSGVPTDAYLVPSPATAPLTPADRDALAAGADTLRRWRVRHL